MLSVEMRVGATMKLLSSFVALVCTSNICFANIEIGEREKIAAQAFIYINGGPPPEYQQDSEVWGTKYCTSINKYDTTCVFFDQDICNPILIRFSSKDINRTRELWKKGSEDPNVDIDYLHDLNFHGIAGSAMQVVNFKEVLSKLGLNLSTGNDKAIISGWATNIWSGQAIMLTPRKQNENFYCEKGPGKIFPVCTDLRLIAISPQQSMERVRSAIEIFTERNKCVAKTPF